MNRNIDKQLEKGLDGIGWGIGQQKKAKVDGKALVNLVWVRTSRG